MVDQNQNRSDMNKQKQPLDQNRDRADKANIADKSKSGQVNNTEDRTSRS